MKINLEEISEEMVEGARGGTGKGYSKTYEDEYVKIVIGKLEPGASVGEHTHTDDYEVGYVIGGSPVQKMDGVPTQLKAGDIFYCEPGHSHGTVNGNDEDFLYVAVFPKLKK